jgi:polygalacturonase
VTIADSYIYAGDDNLAIKSRTGTSTYNVTAIHNHFYAGHGVGTGSSTSGGISRVRISDLTLDGTGTGINMKSNNKLGGLVHDVEFSDICIRGSQTPISIGTHSSSVGHHEVDATETDKFPQYTDIRFNNIWIDGGSRVTVDGLDPADTLKISFKGVLASDPGAIKTSGDNAEITLDDTNLDFSGPSVVVDRKPGASKPSTCPEKFVPFPVPVAVK